MLRGNVWSQETIFRCDARRCSHLMPDADATYIQFGTHVEIASRFSRDELVAQYEDSLLKKHTTPGVDGWEGEEQDAKEVNRLWWASLKQQIPFFAGRLLAHSTGERFPVVVRPSLRSWH